MPDYLRDPCRIAGLWKICRLYQAICEYCWVLNFWFVYWPWCLLQHKSCFSSRCASIQSWGIIFSWRLYLTWWDCHWLRLGTCLPCCPKNLWCLGAVTSWVSFCIFQFVPAETGLFSLGGLMTESRFLWLSECHWKFASESSCTLKVCCCQLLQGLPRPCDWCWSSTCPRTTFWSLCLHSLWPWAAK